MLFTTIEIERSPEEVRRVFFDFPAYPAWHQGFVKSIKPLSPSSDSEPFAAGKQLHCKLNDMDFDVVITENSPTTFQWQGPPVMGIAGLHTFCFEPSKLTKGGTTFIQKEEYTGLLSFLVQSWLAGRSLYLAYLGFNADLKKRAESGP